MINSQGKDVSISPSDIPMEVKGLFDCSDNKLIINAVKIILDFYCSGYNLTNLNGSL